MSRYQKGKTNLDFTEARDNEWQWHQLGHVQVCTLLQTDNHASTPPLSFLQAGCPSCCPAYSIKALKVRKKERKNKIRKIILITITVQKLHSRSKTTAIATNCSFSRAELPQQHTASHWSLVIHARIATFLSSNSNHTTS